MEIKIRGEKSEITDAMKDYAKEKLAKLTKYLKEGEELSATILFKVRDPKQKVEVTIPLRSMTLRVEETGNDFYSAIDTAIDKLERQIRKNKTRLLSKKTKEKYDYFKDFDTDLEDMPEKIIKRKTIEIKPMSEEEALLQMELLDHDFYFFKNTDTNKTAVLYKRKEEGYGIIEEK